MTKSSISIFPLGGLKQIGGNMILLKTEQEAALIDCGILFPNDQCFDINYLIPNYRDLNNINKIFITHGHEDHIGGIVHLLNIFPNITIYAPRFAAILIESKLQRYNINKKIEIFDTNSILTLGKIEVHPIQVNHSIPDTFGFLFLDKKINTAIFYASDFKIDLNSPYEPAFELDKLHNLANKFSTRIFMADSTNILNPGKTPSEGDIISAMSNLISGHPHRIFITLFASNIHRLQTIFNIAHTTKRPIYCYGRSLHRYIDLAIQLNLLTTHNYMGDACTDIENNAIVLLTGCQGEFKGALRRVATGNNPYFTPTSTDLFIFSSKTIPGNAKAISQVMNNISEFQSTIVTEKDHLIHVSGHPGQEDLKIVLHHFKPTNYIPVHGESFFLQRQIEWIRKNFPTINPHFVLNNSQINITSTGITVQAPKDDNPPLIVHGENIIIEREHLAVRRKMATLGLLLVVINRKSKNYEIEPLGLPNFFTINYIQKMEQIVEYYIGNNSHGLLEQIRIELRREANKYLGYKPLVIVKEL